MWPSRRQSAQPGHWPGLPAWPLAERLPPLAASLLRQSFDHSSATTRHSVPKARDEHPERLLAATAASREEPSLHHENAREFPCLPSGERHVPHQRQLPRAERLPDRILAPRTRHWHECVGRLYLYRHQLERRSSFGPDAAAPPRTD